jgi:alkylation response protein AidB-like acyl-CoA dehydrogenase
MKPFLDSILFTLRVNRASQHHLELARDFLPTISTFAQHELYPLNKPGDRIGCKRIDKEHVVTPPGFKDAYNIYRENGWHGISFPQEYGGSELPNSLNIIKSEILSTANWSWSMYPGLGLGAANTILKHGSQSLKQAYLGKLVTGDTLGTMCLTEPQCGSDLSLVNTRATSLNDGTYSISGTKIFISCGNHDLTENIVHCVLARLDDAPPGLRGISLFLVPKYTNKSFNSFNNVNTARLENKMGCHGSSTCELNFEDARGYLIGEENKGINHMFTFINTSRIGVALQAVAASEMAHQLALDYAENRRAMRSLDKTKQDLKFPADLIIVHPDVQNMLNTIQCFTEGGRSMLYECALLADGTDKDSRLEFLTPILKGFLSERGIESTQLGIQVFGGHGYIFENGMEQLARDTRISSIYEGTTGIQALDLLARKILLQKMKPLDDFCKRTRYELYNHPLDVYTIEMFRKINEWQLFTYKFARKLNKSRDYESIGRIAVDYLMYSGYIVMGLHMLRLGRMDSSKMKLVDHYYNYILPRTRGHVGTMRKVGFR